MTDQKLVDELEKALRDEAYDGGMGALGPEEFTDYVRTLAVTAVEAAEKALTPSDDEREALLVSLNELRSDMRHNAHEVAVLERAITALRRSEVPEPSTEDERIEAWHYVADHEAFKACYDEEQPLIDSILARITQLHELESTVNELAPAPTLPLEPSDTSIERYLLEEWKHERWGYGDDGVPRCECGDRLHEGDYGPVRSLEQHRVRVSLVAAVTEQGENR